jgi:putative FmdB family regulatory protein
MPRYDYYCKICDEKVEIIKPMAQSDTDEICNICSNSMTKIFMGQNVGTPNKDYSHEIVSHSLAMNPSQISEHKRLFPDIKVRADGCPVFDNYKKHDDYLKKIGVYKADGKVKKRGTVIKKGQ